MAEDGGTIIEEFINSTELLPNDIRRNSELMRELDKDMSDTVKEIEAAEKSFIERIDIKRIAEPQPEDIALLRDIRVKRMKCSQKNDEKISIAEQTLEVLESFIRKLDNDLGVFENLLRSSGDFETTGAPAGQEVAVKTDMFTEDWILAHVVDYNLDTGYYDVADADETSIYHLPESQVIVLNLATSQKKLSKGETVLAVYPDTTSLYPAIVSQAPRRSAAGGAGIEPSVIVQFMGDADETGQTPHRSVPLRHVMRPPVAPYTIA